MSLSTITPVVFAVDMSLQVCSMCTFGFFPDSDSDVSLCEQINVLVSQTGVVFEHQACRNAVEDVIFSRRVARITMSSPVLLDSQDHDSILNEYARDKRVVAMIDDVSDGDFARLVSYGHDPKVLFDDSRFSFYFRLNGTTMLPLSLPLKGLFTTITTNRITIDVAGGNHVVSYGSVWEAVRTCARGSLAVPESGKRDPIPINCSNTSVDVFVLPTRQDRNAGVVAATVMGSVSFDIVIVSMPTDAHIDQLGDQLRLQLLLSRDAMNRYHGQHDGESKMSNDLTIMSVYDRSVVKMNRATLAHIQYRLCDSYEMSASSSTIWATTASQFTTPTPNLACFSCNVAPGVDLIGDGVYVYVKQSSENSPMLMQYSGAFVDYADAPVPLVATNAIVATETAHKSSNGSKCQLLSDSNHNFIAAMSFPAK
jgi:hypothetical protein